MGLSWAILEAIDEKRGRRLFAYPPRGPKNRLLGPSWALLGARGAVLGPSWAHIGAVLGHLGAIWRPPEPIGSEKARRPKTFICPKCSKDFVGRLLDHLKPSCGGGGASWRRASWRHVVRYLAPCWAILRDLGGHLGLSGALLEPPWAILGARTARDRPRPGPGEGSPKGERGVGRKRVGPKPFTP